MTTDPTAPHGRIKGDKEHEFVKETLTNLFRDGKETAQKIANVRNALRSTGFNFWDSTIKNRGIDREFVLKLGKIRNGFPHPDKDAIMRGSRVPTQVELEMIGFDHGLSGSDRVALMEAGSIYVAHCMLKVLEATSSTPAPLATEAPAEPQAAPEYKSEIHRLLQEIFQKRWWDGRKLQDHADSSKSKPVTARVLKSSCGCTVDGVQMLDGKLPCEILPRVIKQDVATIKIVLRALNAKPDEAQAVKLAHKAWLQANGAEAELIASHYPDQPSIATGTNQGRTSQSR